MSLPRPAAVRPASALVLALALLLGAPGRGPAAASLDAALQGALATSPSLEAARARLRAAKEGPAVARAAGRPQVQATASQGYALLKDAGGGGARYTTRNALELRQPVHTGGALEAGLRRADRLVVAERARLARAEQEALLAAVEVYGRLGLARASLGLAHGHEARAGTELDAARQRFRLGDATTTDVARAEARLAGAAADGRLAYVDQPESELSRRGEASVGAVVTWPLYAGGGDRARVRQARQGVAQRRQEARGERLDLARDARAAWRARATARVRVESVRGQARAAGVALEGARAEAILGLRTVVEVLDAEEDLYEAELALERARHEALLAGWVLAAASGELTAAGLGLASEPEPDLPGAAPAAASSTPRPGSARSGAAATRAGPGRP